MLFHSLDFAVFLPLVFALYWLAARHGLRWQNAVLVAASYIFYGWWDWRFLFLILLSTLVDFICGLGLAKTDQKATRKRWLWASILVNLGLLGFFKYYNFFLDNFAASFTLFGGKISTGSLNIILPVGISFYTFQTLSYTIDVYRRKLEPTRDFIAFSAFVSFFPQLVAGPIERAGNLLPQFYTSRSFDHEKAINGLRQILWGLFKKVVIADNCAVYANLIFNNSDTYSGSTLLLGAFLFSIQIYGDFSGYSDIAIGTARLFGIDLMRNFAFPYFSRSMAEFWRRWHISLSTWFRDYVYIPLGGSKGSTWMRVRNTFIIFLVSGFWHGANWTFVAWGFLHALYMLPSILLQRNRNNLDVVAQGRYLPTAKEFVQVAFTFVLTMLAWVFFRAENMGHAISYLGGMLSLSLFSLPEISVKILLGVVGVFLLIEWLGREEQYAIARLPVVLKKPLRWAAYYVIICAILFFGVAERQFIYFQF